MFNIQDIIKAPFGGGGLLSQATDEIKSKVSGLGVNTDEIDADIDNQIQAQQSKQLSRQKVSEILQNAPEGASQRVIIEGLIDRGYTIEGIDNTKIQKPTQPTLPTTAIGAGLEKVKGPIIEGVGGITGGTSNIIEGAFTQTPEIAGNIAGFLTDVADFINPIDNALEAIIGAEEGTTLFDLEGLADQFRADGIESKEKLQEMIGLDPEALTTKIGEFGAEAGSLFIPGGQVGLASKLPQLKSSLPIIEKALTKFETSSPKAFNAFKNSIIGATESGKFGVVAEGEVTPTGVVAGAVANPVIQKIGAGFSSILGKDISGLLSKVIRPISKGRTNNQITKEMESIAGSLKEFNKRPGDIAKFYDDLTDIQKKLYTNKILPALEAAGQKETSVNISNIMDDFLPSLAETTQVKGKTLLTQFGKGAEEKKLNTVIENLRKNFSDINILEAEQIKKFTSAILQNKNKSADLTQLEITFLEKLNQALGTKIDDIVAQVDGIGVKGFKSQYGAIARNIDELNKVIIRENNRSGESLFSGLGKISGINEIISGNIKGGTAQIFTGELLKLMKDPNTFLKKALNKIYASPEKGISETVTGITTGKLGGDADIKQKEKAGIN